MSWLAILPLASFVFAAVLIRRRTASCWRTATVEAAVAWGVTLTLITEALSAVRFVRFGSIAAAWAAVAAALFVSLIRSARGAQTPVSAAGRGGAELPRSDRALVCAASVILAVIGVIALLAPPNNWDSAAYHMARVAHWVQDGSLRHYPTSYLPELYHPPWAELAILHFQVLLHGDRLANLVQWFSMIGAIVTVSLVARALGADLRGQTFAAVFATTLPMALLQGSSTQNDLVAALWITAFSYFVLRAVLAPPEHLRSKYGLVDAMWIGAALGLALLTKGTSYVYAAPFAIALAVVTVWRIRWSALRPALIVAALVLVINGPHYGRNVSLFGSPLSEGAEKYTNEIHTPAAFASNVVRNLSLHVGTPMKSVNDRIDGAIRRLHDVLNIDVDDARTTSWGSFQIHRLNMVEDKAGNPLHLALMFWFVAWFVCGGWRRTSRLSGGYAGAVLAASAMFCLTLKWQPWHGRLHLPLFVLFAPLVGLALSKVQRRGAAVVTVVVLLVACLPWVLFNSSRSLFPVTPGRRTYSTVFRSRIDQYFANGASEHLKEPYLGATAFLRHLDVSSVGLALPPDAWEYQLWVLLQRDRPEMRLDHVAVRNVSSDANTTADVTPPPAVLRVRSDGDSPDEGMWLGDATYTVGWSMGPVDVLVKSALPR